MHIVVIAKIELRASVSMLQYPGRARKVVHLISNTRLLLLLPLPNCPASSSKIHMLTQPRYAKPHHTISVAVFFHIQYLCLKKKKKKFLLLQCQFLDAWPTLISTSRPNYRNHFPCQVFMTHPSCAPSYSIHTYVIGPTTFTFSPLSPTSNHQ